jgi:exosortase/archaeosortase family protein
MSRLSVLLGLLLAGWPVLRWYGLRLHDGSDEPLGLVAFAAACFFAPRSGWRERLPPSRIFVLTALIAGYALAYFWIPALARALIFVLMIGLAVAPKTFALAWTTLLVLSLPLLSTLQFYLSYPLRLPTTELSAFLLRVSGVNAHASGTTLLWAGERVIVDAPCSGIQMAWSGMFVAAALACWHRLSQRDTLRLFRRTGALVFVANVLRSTVLFFLGSGLWPLPGFAHEGIGLLLFALTVILIYICSIRRPHSSPFVT